MTLIDELMIQLEINCDGRTRAKIKRQLDAIERRIADARRHTDEDWLISDMIKPFVHETTLTIMPHSPKINTEIAEMIYDMISND